MNNLIVEMNWKIIGQEFLIIPQALIFNQDGKLIDKIDRENKRGVLNSNDIINKYGILLEDRKNFKLNFEILSSEVSFIIFLTSKSKIIR